MSLINRLENYSLDFNSIIDNDYLKSHDIGKLCSKPFIFQ